MTPEQGKQILDYLKRTTKPIEYINPRFGPKWNVTKLEELKRGKKEKVTK